MDTRTSLAAALVVFVLAMAVALAFNSYSKARQKKREILARLSGASLSEADPIESQSILEWLKSSLLSIFTAFGEKLSPKKPEEISGLRVSLVQAGFRQQKAVEVFWGIKIGMALLGLALSLIFCFFILKNVQPTAAISLGIFIAILFLYMPSYVLSKRIAWRREQVQHGLPDALDLLVVCVEAGMGLDIAINRVGLEMKRSCPVLSEEFRSLTLELRAGRSRREGLKDFAERIGLDDVNSLVALLIQADTFGTSIATTLRVYSDSMRTKRYQKAEEIAAKLPVKLMIPLIFFILPPLFIVIMGPGILSLMKTFETINK